MSNKIIKFENSESRKKIIKQTMIIHKYLLQLREIPLVVRGAGGLWLCTVAGPGLWLAEVMW